MPPTTLGSRHWRGPIRYSDRLVDIYMNHVGPMNTKRRRIRARLLRFARVVGNIGCALRAVGGWAPLVRQLGRGRRTGWRDVYGTLIGLVAIGGRHRHRWYRRWLERAEPAVETGAVREASSKLALAISVDRLDDAELDFLVDRVAQCSLHTVFVDAGSAQAETARTALGRAGVTTVLTRGELDSSMLASGCTGLVLLGRNWCPNPVHLGALSAALERGPDLVYGDSDEIDAKGRRRRPRLKPDFSIDLFLYEDFASGFLGVSRAFLEASREWDFADPHGSLLKWLPAANRIEHLPLILGHALHCGRPPHEPPAFLQSFLGQRYGEGARVEQVASEQSSPSWRCRFGTEAARISVVIPTRDRLDLLAPCVRSLFETNDPARFEVLVVDNASTESATREWLASMTSSRESFRVVGADCEFNWSRLSNLGIDAGTGDVFVFLNNDTLSVDSGWLDRLAEYAVRDGTGAVGPLLLYEDGSIQHAGLIIGYGDLADQIYRGTRPDFDDHAFVSPLLPRNVAAVTGACLAVSRRTIEAIGPFDTRLPVSGDVEFCLRALDHGLCNVYAADVALHHYESRTLGRRTYPEDTRRLARLVNERMPRDPFYNPNLTRVAGVGRGGPDFALLHDDTASSHLLAASSTPPAAKPRPPKWKPPPSKKTPNLDPNLDFVFFWKQNDTGIYGRRQDMLVKYLAKHPRVHRIFHFDVPIDVRTWLRHPLSMGLRGTEATSVVRQTLRRKFRLADYGNVRFDTFLYLDSRRVLLGSLFRLLGTSRDYSRFLHRIYRRHKIGGRRTVFWVCPTVFDFPALCDWFQPDLVVADIIDDQRQWPTTPEHRERLDRNYEEVLSRSDVALANCSSVLRAMSPLAANIHLVANAAEILDEESRQWQKPVELRRLAGPVIGYVGNLDAIRMDLGLVAAIAEKRPDWNLVFIGSAQQDNRLLALARRGNVHILGVRPYHKALRYIRHFDVAMIPHLDNALTRHMNPLKMYVYFALRVPIVATPIANTDAIGEFVEVGRSTDEFINRIEHCLEHDVLAGREARIKELLRENSWNDRVDRIMALVDQALAEKAASGQASRES